MNNRPLLMMKELSEILTGSFINKNKKIIENMSKLEISEEWENRKLNLGDSLKFNINENQYRVGYIHKIIQKLIIFPEEMFGNKLDDIIRIYNKEINKFFNTIKYYINKQVADKNKYMFCMPPLIENPPFVSYAAVCPISFISIQVTWGHIFGRNIEGRGLVLSAAPCIVILD